MMLIELVIALLSPITQLILDEVKKCKERNSPEKKQLKSDIEDMIYEWQENWEKEEKKLYNKYLSWHEHEKEINEAVEKLSKEKPISDEYFDGLFRWSIEKAKVISHLIKRQIEWYDKDLDLSHQLNKEKELFIKQLNEDLNTYFEIIMSPGIDPNKEYQEININDFIAWHSMTAEFKESVIKWTNNLLEKIIQRISTK